MFRRGLDFRTSLRKSNFLSQDDALVVATFAAALRRWEHQQPLLGLLYPQVTAPTWILALF